MNKYLESLIDLASRPAYHLHPDTHLTTNTWEGRHEHTLARVRQFIHGRYHNVRIAIFGPGGVAEEWADKLPKGDESQFRGSLLQLISGRNISENTRKLLRRRKQQLLSYRESRLRDRKDTHLVTFEPREIYLSSESVGVQLIDVYDKVPAVLAAVKRLKLPTVRTFLLDIEDPLLSPLPKYDLVFALAVLEYCNKNIKQASSTITSASARGGLLAGTFEKDTSESLRVFTYLDQDMYYNGELFIPPHLNEEDIARRVTA